MSIIKKLRAARQDAAKACIRQLEEALEEAQKDGQDDWARLTKEIAKARDENTRLKVALEKAQDENTAILAGDLVIGPACRECINSLHVYEANSEYPPTVICRLKIRCKMFSEKDAAKVPEEAENGTATKE